MSTWLASNSSYAEFLSVDYSGSGPPALRSANPCGIEAKNPGVQLEGSVQYVTLCVPQSILSVITASVVNSHRIPV